jgi:SAM-dependent methyltransferase
LREVLLPRLANRSATVLLVGCQRYTARDPIFLQDRGVACWTLDMDPAAAIWGAPGQHVVGRVERAVWLFGPAKFDSILLSGVFGFGVDRLVEQDEAVQACGAVLKPGGLLVLGWNTNRVRDPSRLPGLVRHFRRSSDPALASRVSFARSTHVFDFFVRSDISTLHSQDKACRPPSA